MHDVTKRLRDRTRAEVHRRAVASQKTRGRLLNGLTIAIKTTVDNMVAKRYGSYYTRHNRACSYCCYGICSHGLGKV